MCVRHRPFPNFDFIFFLIFIIWLVFEKTCKLMVICAQKNMVAKLQAKFPRILGVFYFKIYCQTSLKFVLVMFGLVFMKFIKLKCCH